MDDPTTVNTWIRKKLAIAVKQPVGAGGIDRFAGHQTEKDYTQRSADAVHAPDIEGIIPFQSVLQADGEVADGPGQDTDDGRTGRRDVPGAGGDGRQSGHGAGQKAEEFRFLFEYPRQEHPDRPGERGGDIGVEKRQSGDGIDFQFAAGIEAVPAEPQQTGAQGHQRNAVGNTVADRRRPTYRTEASAAIPAML